MAETNHYATQKKLIEKICFSGPILDLACGAGYLLKEIKDKQKYGNDISKEMLKIAKINNPLVEFTTDDVHSLVSHNRKYKALICCNLFFYLQDSHKAVKRWISLLDSDGKLIVLEEYPFIYPKGLKYFGSLVNPVTISEIEKIMKSNGLILEQKQKESIDSAHDLYMLVFKK